MKLKILIFLIIFLILPTVVLSRFIIINASDLKPDFNFLLLGYDQRDDSLEKTTTTDTIIFGSFNNQANKISLISLPRDLWDYNQQQKINQIYPNSLSATDKFVYIKDLFEPIIGQNVDKVVIMSTNNLIDLTNLIGGVDVYLDKALKDDQYPNPEYVTNPSPDISIYKTIEFPSGWNHLDASNITQYVRSRKSSDSSADGGTDLGRILRQQLLIDALLTKIRSPDFISNFKNMTNLYQFFKNDLITDITDNDLLAILLNYRQKLLTLSLNRIEIPISNDPKYGPIYDPERLVNKQWVFLPSDKNYDLLKNFITSSFSR